MLRKTGKARDNSVAAERLANYRGESGIALETSGIYLAGQGGSTEEVGGAANITNPGASNTMTSYEPSLDDMTGSMEGVSLVNRDAHKVSKSILVERYSTVWHVLAVEVIFVWSGLTP